MLDRLISNIIPLTIALVMIVAFCSFAWDFYAAFVLRQREQKKEWERLMSEMNKPAKSNQPE